MVGETPKSLDYKRNQIKTTLRFQLSPVRMAIIKKKKCFQDCKGETGPLYSVGGEVNMSATMETTWKFHTKLSVKSSKMAQQVKAVVTCLATRIPSLEPTCRWEERPLTHWSFPLTFTHMPWPTCPPLTYHADTHKTITFLKPRIRLPHDPAAYYSCV